MERTTGSWAVGEVVGGMRDLRQEVSPSFQDEWNVVSSHNGHNSIRSYIRVEAVLALQMGMLENTLVLRVRALRQKVAVQTFFGSSASRATFL